MGGRAGTARKWTLRAAGTVAVGAAAHQVATGVGGVRGVASRDASAAPPNLDSELRFYAAWYAAAGVLMHQAATSRPLDRQLSPVLTGAWSLAAFSRLLSMRAVGRPDPVFVGLTALEFALAGLLAATRPGEASARRDVCGAAAAADQVRHGCGVSG